MSSRVGRYEIVDRLGEGGMGVVYLARDPQLQRTVAIKMLSGQDGDTESHQLLRRRFAREASSVASLKHNHIVTIYDIGEHEGRPFIAMEYLDGESMAQIIARQAPLDMAYKLRLMRELCSGLGYAHRRGIIHRDIKPANLMITGDGSLKILDFGLARVTSSVPNADLTQVGALMGTPHYMSPEQILGEPADQRSDIFAVGVVLYELLAYRKAFEAETPQQVLLRILQAEPFAIRDLVPDLDPGLQRAVAKAMAKEPESRYQTLDVLAADLSQVASRSDAALAGATIRMAPRPRAAAETAAVKTDVGPAMDATIVTAASMRAEPPPSLRSPSKRPVVLALAVAFAIISAIAVYLSMGMRREGTVGASARPATASPTSGAGETANGTSGSRPERRKPEVATPGTAGRCPRPIRGRTCDRPTVPPFFSLVAHCGRRTYEVSSPVEDNASVCPVPTSEGPGARTPENGRRFGTMYPTHRASRPGRSADGGGEGFPDAAVPPVKARPLGTNPSIDSNAHLAFRQSRRCRQTEEALPGKPASHILLTGVLAAAVSLIGCAKKAPAPKPPADIDLKGAAAYIAGDLVKQLGPASTSRKVVSDPLLDRSTGQQTGISVRVEEEFIAAAALKGLTVVPLNADGAEQSGLVATGSVATVAPPDQYGINIALTDRTSSLVIAQSAARFRQSGLSAAPTRFYSESPSLVRDRSVDGYLKTSETPAGSLADPLYVEQLPTAALISAALAAYNEGRWDAALLGYSAAAARPSGQNLRTFNGIYLANMRLGRTSAAEDAFAKIAALGLATNNLAVKLLFRPGTTEFLADPNFSGVYPMWIRQIARAARASQSCLNITGHTSASGSEGTNDRLSVARATAVRALLEREAPGLERRWRVTGLGSRRNLIGTGTDDASDALDRRVEFEVEACGK